MFLLFETVRYFARLRLKGQLEVAPRIWCFFAPCLLSSCLQILDNSRVPTEETAHAWPRGNLERAAPGVALATVDREPPAEWGTPHAAGGRRLARRDSRHQPASCGPRRLRPARSRPRRKAGPAGRLRAHRHAHSTRSDALAPRAPTCIIHALRRAHPARTDSALATRTTRASGAFSAHSRDARHASPLSHSSCDRYLVHSWAPLSNHTVYRQDEKRSSFLAADRWADAFLFCKLFSCKTCPKYF